MGSSLPLTDLLDWIPSGSLQTAVTQRVQSPRQTGRCFCLSGLLTPTMWPSASKQITHAHTEKWKETYMPHRKKRGENLPLYKMLKFQDRKMFFAQRPCVAFGSARGHVVQGAISFPSSPNRLFFLATSVSLHFPKRPESWCKSPRGKSLRSSCSLQSDATSTVATECYSLTFSLWAAPQKSPVKRARGSGLREITAESSQNSPVSTGARSDTLLKMTLWQKKNSKRILAV